MNLNSPTVIEAVQNSGGGSTNSKHCISPWLDTGATDIPHYGLKYYLNTPIPLRGIEWCSDVYVSCFLEYKDTR